MKGDFSKWRFKPKNNFNAVLHQQGRVLLDSDWNEEVNLTNDWRITTGKDVIGSHTAAIPAGEPSSFKVKAAQKMNGEKVLDLMPGRAWIDGHLVRLEGNDPVKRKAVYLADTTGNIDNVTKEAVILEVWQEAVSGFQMPDLLIEPALGGPDTTERLHTAMAFRLLRLKDDDDCSDIQDKLKDDLTARGKLKVTLQPTNPTQGDCPVVDAGGYTGFEHNLYRIEIAHINQGQGAVGPMFKWSRYNGGLVGRGDFNASDPANKKITIKANLQPLTTAGLEDLGKFYIEVVEFNDEEGHWQITYGAEASLNGNVIEITTEKYVLQSLPSGDIFFRIWDGLEDISSYPKATGNNDPNELRDGIRLEFDTDSGSIYPPSDYWTFNLKAGEVKTPLEEEPNVLLKDQIPHGIHYYRAPLAILDWKAASSPTITAPTNIHDCRSKFPPLVDVSLGCCIEVEPGKDIHHALNKVVKAGGGCICLLPGNHILTKPIDLSELSGIHFKGFGRVSRLYITDKLNNKTPFFLSNSKDISFESFAVFSSTGEPVWSCQNTTHLNIKNMFVSTTLAKVKHSLILINGKDCHQWQLENNEFLAPIAISGDELYNSSISHNVFLGTFGGIDLRYLKSLSISGNRFSGIHHDLITKFDVSANDLLNDNTRNLHLANITTRAFIRPIRTEIAPNYVGINLEGIFDTDILDNHFEGAVGLNTGLVQNCKIHSNNFLTTVTGGSCGLIHSLRFSENNIGLKNDVQKKEKDIQCRLGLSILTDAVDCQIVNNSFSNVQEGIVFESDLDGKKAISRDYSVNILALKDITSETTKLTLADSEARISGRFDKSRLLTTPYFRIGRCERILIQANHFYATQTAIEWSGTKNIIDFRIVNNSFVGCQDVAVQIEPDDRIFFLSDPVDTKVRLIEKNRFEIYSGAVRSTIGAVRVEKNDIRIKAPTVKFVPPVYMLAAAAENVLKLAPFTKAVINKDVPMLRMMSTEAIIAVEKNPATIDTAGFSKAIGDKILKVYKPKTGDVLADNAYVLKTIADISKYEYLPPLIIHNIPKMYVNTEGFAVNLSGVQNRVVHNRVFSDNTDRSGGVLFHILSGEVRDNEISVQGTALLLNGKLGLSSAYQGIEIVGNSLIASGIPGDKTAVYALAIPSLSPGNISITNNQFKGSVMVGGDPISAQGLTKKEEFKIPPMIIYYNIAKYDTPTYAASLINKVFPAKAGTFGKFTPPLIYIPTWLLNPHANRPVVQFSNNRIIQGWLGIFQALSGVYWPKELLEKQGYKALVANLTGNVLDYGGSIVGYDVIIVGNHSQIPLKFRAGREKETIANIPEAQSF